MPRKIKHSGISGTCKTEFSSFPFVRWKLNYVLGFSRGGKKGKINHEKENKKDEA